MISVNKVPVRYLCYWEDHSISWPDDPRKEVLTENQILWRKIMENVWNKLGRIWISIFELQKWLIYFTGKKGGALLSALHSNMQHGDPFVKSLVRHTLNLVSFKCLGWMFVPGNPNGLGCLVPISLAARSITVLTVLGMTVSRWSLSDQILKLQTNFFLFCRNQVWHFDTKNSCYQSFPIWFWWTELKTHYPWNFN